VPDGSPVSFDMLIAFAVLIGAFVLFVIDRMPPQLTAMTAMAVLLVTGVISTDDALGVFSNSATATIAAMCILSAALERTGVIDVLGRWLIAMADRSRFVTIAAMMLGVAAVSAFMNNTPVVIIMAPVVIAVARQLKDSPTLYLIPLSYMAILGGTCTLIGTSTNILTDGVATANGQAPFSMFEVTPAACLMALAGISFVLGCGRFLLPRHELLDTEVMAESPRTRYIAEAVIPEGSHLIGKTLNEVVLTSEEGYAILDLVRERKGNRNALAGLRETMRELRADPGDNKPKSTMRDLPLQAGDRLVFRSDKAELLELKDSTGITFDIEGSTETYRSLMPRQTTVREGVVGPNSRFVGRSPADLRLRRHYDSYIVAVSRDRRSVTTQFDTFRLRRGDVLLFEGPTEELDRMFAQEDILPVTHLPARPLQPVKAAITVAVILSVVGLSALDVMPIAGLAIAGAIVAILAGCLTVERAYESIEWPILMLIFGMLAVSTAMAKSGAATLIVELVASAAKDFGPLAMLAAVYMLTSLFTEVLSNNACAVLITPIVIGIAEQAGLNPRPLVVAVMLGASASFATPIGYQTNTYVYNIGNYRFVDFLKIGVPMNILMLIVAVLVIPMFWPLTQ
jgi:di/tricarboxylate transporter